MTLEAFIDVFKSGIILFIIVVSPILLISLIIGLIISIFQAVTQIHEQTLTFAPKIIVTFLVLAVLFGWITQKLLDFTFEILVNYLGMV